MFPADFQDFPVELRQDQTLLRDWAWRYRDDKDALKVIRQTVNVTGPTWKRGNLRDTFDIYYHRENGNVFTKETLLTMKHVEDSLYNMTEYQEKYCQIDKMGQCTNPTSILRYFDGTYAPLNPIFYDPEFNNISKVLYTASTNAFLSSEFLYFRTKESQINPTSSYAKTTRSSLNYGWPLNLTGNDEQHRRLMENFQIEKVQPKMEGFARATSARDGLGISFISTVLFAHDAPIFALVDMSLAIGSLLFIFFYIWFQTGTFFVTSLAVVSIVFCFFITNVIYRLVLDYRYFGYFHLIAIFIILGIGADDIFVFFNTWKATGRRTYPTLEHRLSDCYKRSAGTMFFTSLTTTMAFLSSGTSPLLGIGSFGIFMGVLVAVNYFSVIIFFPAVVIMYHYHYEDKFSCRTMCCRCVARKNDSQSMEAIVPPPGGDDEKRVPLLVVFFRDHYFRFVTHRYIRWIIIAIFLSVIGFFIYAATLLKVDTGEVDMNHRSTNLKINRIKIVLYYKFYILEYC